MAQSNPISLLGPPEIYHPTTTTSTTTNTDPLMDLMVTNFNTTSLHKSPPMGLTENCSPTFLSTGNPCLDFFFHVVPDTPPETLIQRLELAWKHDPLKALKLVCNLRGVRGKGKSDKEGLYTAALWLHKNHPKTLACNVASFADFGYFKDLLEILFRILDGPDARKLAKEMYAEWKAMNDAKVKHKKTNELYKKWKEMKSEQRRSGVRRFQAFRCYKQTVFNRLDRSHGRNRPNVVVPRNEKSRKSGATMSREEKRIERAKKVVERFNRDPDFKFLHDRVSDLFAEHLRSDMKVLNSEGESKKYSLAAKWCPSLYSSFDNITLLCETIAKKVFPRDEYPEYQGVDEAHYAYRVRDRLRKQVLVPLRKALELPEVYMGANDWRSIKYNRVASVAMKLYKDKFFKHDEARFRDYLDDVRTGKAKIAAGAMMPHELIGSLWDPEVDPVAELQWNRIVDDMLEKGKLNNCLAICDVSGSMSGTPMDVSVALGMLVSELSEEPWKGKLITFSSNPELQIVEGDTLTAKKYFVKKMEWNMNTDFQKVFDLLLEVAVNGKLRPDQMIKRLFVFSDMEFDQASQNPWETDYQAIVRKFNEKGYGDCVPEIVFWNLRDSKATPVPSNQPGVALVSGFSKNLMTLFLEEGGVLDPMAVVVDDDDYDDGDGDGDDGDCDETPRVRMDPEAVMEAAIAGEEYQKLIVFD